MFDGSDGDQFNQFIAASSRTSPFPINPLSFPSANGNLSLLSAGFEPFTSSSSSSIHTASIHLPKPESNKSPNNHTIDDADEEIRPPAAWSNEEFLALLKARSTILNWFPQFQWDHVSSKLLELGYKRSGDECKQKFEEETEPLHRNCRMFGELEDFCAVAAEIGNQNEQVEDKSGNADDDDREMSEEVVEKPMEMSSKSPQEQDHRSNQKRKREDRFEMMKALCESVVKRMMAQQEEFHNKLIEDLVKRDEENVAREEAWKKQEMERLEKEIEIRRQEQALAVERQAAIIEFLKKLSSSDQNHHYQEIQDFIAVNTNPNPLLATPKCSIPSPRPSSSRDSNNNGKEDVGDKRWPREQVLALINLRCKMLNNSSENEMMNKEIGAKGPLWERISQGMLELGYKKSAKKCKEKWENINKYFRKTKDINKKRSLDSRTCPYFHQLSCLYNEGTLVPTSSSPSNLSEN